MAPTREPSNEDRDIGNPKPVVRSTQVILPGVTFSSSSSPLNSLSEVEPRSVKIVRRVATGVAIVMALVIIGAVIVNVGTDHRWWGLRWELGNVAGYVSAIATFLAVGVAFIFNRRSVKAAQSALDLSERSLDASRQAAVDADIRAKSDRVYAHRRENVKAVADMWAALGDFADAAERMVTTRVEAQPRPPLVDLSQDELHRRAREGDPIDHTTWTTSDKYEDASNLAIFEDSHDEMALSRAKADAAVLYARVITDAGEVLKHIDTAVQMYKDLQNDVNQPPVSMTAGGREVLVIWERDVRPKIMNLRAFRDDAVESLRKNLPLHDQAERLAIDARKRAAEQRAVQRAGPVKTRRDAATIQKRINDFYVEELAKDDLTLES